MRVPKLTICAHTCNLLGTRDATATCWYQDIPGDYYSLRENLLDHRTPR